MRLSLACFAVVLFSVVPFAQVPTEVWDVDGPDNGERMGWSTAGAGLVDGDAIPDALVGSPRADINGSSSGTVTVLSGATGAVIHEVHGNLAGDQLGWSVASVGDRDGDGRDEFIAGTPFEDTNGMSAGVVRVYDGATGSVLFTHFGDAAGDDFGTSVGGGSDVNNDGKPDFFAGAPQDSTGDGYVRIFSGADGSLIRTVPAPGTNSSFGVSVAGLDDLNADGFAEIVAGAYLDSTGGVTNGRAFVFSGIDGSVMHTFEGEDDFDWFGWSVANAGDANDDGLSDILVGAYGDDGDADAGGQATVFSGADWSVLASVTGGTINENLGWTVAGAGDVDGNGDDDFVVGAPFGTTGRAVIVSGTDSSVLHELDGSGSGDQFGRAVMGFGGDINGDGHDDVGVGAPLDDDNGSSSGTLVAISGFQPWLDLGGGSLGIAGQPELVGSGILTDASPVAVTLSNAPPSALMLAWLSFAPVPFMALDGTVHAFPFANQIVFFANPSGVFTGATLWPVGIPTGTQVFFQFVVQDLSSIHDITLSNGLRATTP